MRKNSLDRMRGLFGSLDVLGCSLNSEIDCDNMVLEVRESWSNPAP